jgi:SM-20-related protein
MSSREVVATGPPMIRQDLKRGALRRKLRETGIVQIPHFLKDDWAIALQRGLEDRPRSAWTIAVKAAGEPEYLNEERHSERQLADAYDRAVTSFQNGSFSYCFLRTFDDHGPDCTCVECQFRRWLRGPEMLGFLDDLGLPMTTTADVFASCYEPSHFLAPHHDTGNGQVGFTLSLTREWQPQYGGLLMFLDDDWRRVRRVCTPQFNSLCLFALPPDRKVPHLVSHVIVGRRLAVSGWFHDGDASPSTRTRHRRAKTAQQNAGSG